MPYGIKKLAKAAKNAKGQVCRFAVYNRDTGEVKGKVTSRAEAIRMISAIGANSH